MNKIIINEQQFQNKIINNYAGYLKVWKDSDGAWWYYYFINTLYGEKANNPINSILAYSGSSNKKNIPPKELNDDMVSSSKPVEIHITNYNEEFIGYYEQKSILEHNWPLGGLHKDSKCYNKHARGAKHLGYKEYYLTRGDIQEEKLKEIIKDEEDKNKPDRLKWFKKMLPWVKYRLDNRLTNQGRNEAFQSTQQILHLASEMSKNQDPEHWRINSNTPAYYLSFPKSEDEVIEGYEKDLNRPSEIIGGHGRAYALEKSSMAENGLYFKKIPYELFYMMTKTQLKNFSAWLNRDEGYRQEYTNITTLIDRLYETVLNENLLTKGTKEGGRIPMFEPLHPSLINFFKGYNTLGDSEINLIKNKVTKKFEKKREKEIRKEEGSADLSNKGINSLQQNKEQWDNKISKAFDKLVEEEYNGDESKIDRDNYVKSTRGMMKKYIIEKIYSLKFDGITVPENFVCFVTFEVYHKYEKFIKGKGWGQKKKLDIIKGLFEKILKGNLHIIPIDPRIEKIKVEEKNDNLDSRPSSFREEYGDQTYIGQNEAGIQKGVQV